MKRLAAWIELSQAEVADIDRLRTAHSRLQEEIGAQVNLFSWRDAFARATDAVAGAWRYEVFSVQDQPVRLNTILAGLLLVVFGHRAAHWASALLARTLLRRMAIGRRAAWQTLWFYALFLAELLTASSLFRISLTQFSVVSGALAVGIGFGSQNLISNFISGVILLLERPVNQGDVIEIDGLQVTVERLGARSTIVRTRDNTQMIVPNSRLLEQPVVNWTLSDDIVRRRIAVGVAYESPTRQVAALLQGAVASMETVRKDPVPLVVFADFGENSLLFELYFWVSLAEAFTAENELRHRIAGVFAQERIVMAFPQRDVHLGTTKPLEVMIRRAPAEGAAPENGASL
ncbi:MAG: mechanosensitive ion channel [Opitutaceae bacterium]|nr:mechanosensitive ion channel [Opitutaceae bacterium]